MTSLIFRALTSGLDGLMPKIGILTWTDVYFLHVGFFLYIACVITEEPNERALSLSQ